MILSDSTLVKTIDDEKIVAYHHGWIAHKIMTATAWMEAHALIQ